MYFAQLIHPSKSFQKVPLKACWAVFWSCPKHQTAEKAKFIYYLHGLVNQPSHFLKIRLTYCNLSVYSCVTSCTLLAWWSKVRFDSCCGLCYHKCCNSWAAQGTAKAYGGCHVPKKCPFPSGNNQLPKSSQNWTKSSNCICFQHSFCC